MLSDFFSSIYHTTMMEYWVLHSAYPGGTWRGLEKTMANEDGQQNLKLFVSENEADIYLTEMVTKGILDKTHWTIVKIFLVVPAVRRTTELFVTHDIEIVLREKKND